MEYKVTNLFLEAFGLKVTKAFKPEIEAEGAKNTVLNYDSIEIIESEDEAAEISALGTPIIYPITFVGQKYKTYNDAGEVVYQRMEDFRLPITCIVDFERSKIIGRTKINNNNGGTVKETFGFDDWMVNIKGFCLQDDSQSQGFFTALAQEEELLRWDALIDSIEVRGRLFAMRNITHLVIEKMPMNSLRGKPNVRPITIRAWSDEPLDLIL